jgi:hypothetical protein
MPSALVVAVGMCERMVVSVMMALPRRRRRRALVARRAQFHVLLPERHFARLRVTRNDKSSGKHCCAKQSEFHARPHFDMLYHY